MDSVAIFQDIIQREMEQRASRKAANMPMVERQLIIDEARSQFILLSVGWQQSRYIHQCLIHIQIRGEKIWIHEDVTDPGIYESLIENSVPPSAIVLGYVSELERTGLQMVEIN